jgi:hypothetical protein
VHYPLSITSVWGSVDCGVAPLCLPLTNSLKHEISPDGCGCRPHQCNGAPSNAGWHFHYYQFPQPCRDLGRDWLLSGQIDDAPSGMGRPQHVGNAAWGSVHPAMPHLGWTACTRPSLPHVRSMSEGLGLRVLFEAQSPLVGLSTCLFLWP